MSGGIAELWRLPDKEVRTIDGGSVRRRQVAIRQDNWIGWYKVLPDYGGSLSEIPEGSTPLILNGVWV